MNRKQSDRKNHRNWRVRNRMISITLCQGIILGWLDRTSESKNSLIFPEFSNRIGNSITLHLQVFSKTRQSAWLNNHFYDSMKLTSPMNEHHQFNLRSTTPPTKPCTLIAGCIPLTTTTRWWPDLSPPSILTYEYDAKSHETCYRRNPPSYAFASLTKKPSHATTSNLTSSSRGFHVRFFLECKCPNGR